MSKWIKQAIGRKNTLRQQLEIPDHRNIPIELLKKIIRAKAGQRIRNPTATGKRSILVTHLLERRSIMALNLRRLKR